MGLLFSGSSFHYSRGNDILTYYNIKFAARKEKTGSFSQRALPILIVLYGEDFWRPEIAKEGRSGSALL